MARTLKVEIVGDASSLERAFQSAGKQSQTFGQKVQRGALVAGAALGAGLAVAAKLGFDELAEGQKVAAQTGAALKSTGGIANVTAKDIEGLAQAQSELTGIDDELIQSGENLLLTFKNVRNEVGQGNRVFDRATKAALDLSVAGFGSVESASKMMGKALNDPLKGMTALGRAGVTFSKEQKQTIKDLVATGKTLEAQKLILREVESQVGGSAKAYGETLPGQLNKAKNAFEGMAAGIVVVLLPAVLSVSGALAKLAAFLTEHQTVAKALAAGLVALAGTLLAVGVATKIYAAGQAIAAAATSAWTAAQWLLNAALTANPIGIVVLALAALVAAVVLAYKNCETFRRIVDGAFKAVRAAGEAVLNFFRDNWKIIAVLISGPFAPIVALATDAFGIRSKLIAAGNAVLDFFGAAWKTITHLITAPLEAAVNVIRGLAGAFMTAARSVGNAIKDGVINGIGAVAAWMGAKLGEISSAVGAAATAAGAAAVRIGQSIIAGVLNGLAGLWNAVKNKVEDTLRGVLGSLNPFSPVEHGGELHVGTPIVAGAVTGITKGTPLLLAALTLAVKRIASLSSAFYDAGMALGEGLATGLLDSRGKVVDAANELANAVAAAMNVSTDIRRQAVGDIEARTSQLGQRIPKMAAGGVVTVPTLALIGEGGPEAVIPLAQMGGMGGMGGGITVNVYGSVTAERDLAETIRVELMRTGRYNAGGVLGGLA
jgi:hypothetical protein